MGRCGFVACKSFRKGATLSPFIIEELDAVLEYDLDLSESVQENYRLNDAGRLERFSFNIEIRNISEEKRLNRIKSLNQVIRDGGKVLVAKSNNKFVGYASIESGMYSNSRMQLHTLHIDRHYRNMGIGKALVQAIIGIARKNNAHGLYITSSPKTNTVDFYLKMGATITQHIDQTLYEREPDDIHMEIMWLP